MIKISCDGCMKELEGARLEGSVLNGWIWCFCSVACALEHAPALPAKEGRAVTFFAIFEALPTASSSPAPTLHPAAPVEMIRPRDRLRLADSIIKEIWEFEGKEIPIPAERLSKWSLSLKVLGGIDLLDADGKLELDLGGGNRVSWFPPTPAAPPASSSSSPASSSPAPAAPPVYLELLEPSSASSSPAPAAPPASSSASTPIASSSSSSPAPAASPASSSRSSRSSGANARQAFASMVVALRDALTHAGGSQAPSTLRTLRDAVAQTLTLSGHILIKDIEAGAPLETDPKLAAQSKARNAIVGALPTDAANVSDLKRFRRELPALVDGLEKAGK